MTKIYSKILVLSDNSKFRKSHNFAEDLNHAIKLKYNQSWFSYYVDISKIDKHEINNIILDNISSKEEYSLLVYLPFCFLESQLMINEYVKSLIYFKDICDCYSKKFLTHEIFYNKKIILKKYLIKEKNNYNFLKINKSKIQKNYKFSTNDYKLMLKQLINKIVLMHPKI